VTFVKAVKAFLQVFLGHAACEHRQANPADGPAFCPECGYCVKLEWVFLHCRNCNAKRLPRPTLLAGIKPAQPFCRHCGHENYKIVRKDHIDAYELPYAVSVKSTVYAENPFARPLAAEKTHVRITVESGDIFEAEVLRRTEYRGAKSKFASSPFQWQRHQDPTRYRGKPKPSANTGEKLFLLKQAQ
jgi:hypothetical protein